MLKRIDRIEDVHVGDTVYLKDMAEGFTVGEVDRGSTYAALFIEPHEGSSADALIKAMWTKNSKKFWADNDRFDFAMREVPDIPTAPGFYKDTDGDVWLLDGDGRAQYCKTDGLFIVNGISFIDGLRESLAPYTPMRLVEELV